MNIERELHFIAQRQEPRHGGGQRDGIAHDQVTRTVADFVSAPGNGHNADGAVEVWHFEINVGFAVAANFDDAGIERHDRFNGWVALHGNAARTITAGFQLAAFGPHAVDETAVEIADFKAEFALGVKVVFWCRSFILCEIEDTEINRGDRDAHVFASLNALDLNWHRHFHARLYFGGQIKRNFEFSSALIEADPLDANGAALHAFLVLNHRAIEKRGCVSARAPAGVNSNRNFAAALWHLDFLDLMQAVAEHRNQSLAAGLGGNAKFRSLAGFVGWFIKRNVELFGAIDGVAGCIPAGIEHQRRSWPVRLG